MLTATRITTYKGVEMIKISNTNVIHQHGHGCPHGWYFLSIEQAESLITELETTTIDIKMLIRSQGVIFGGRSWTSSNYHLTTVQRVRLTNEIKLLLDV